MAEASPPVVFIPNSLPAPMPQTLRPGYDARWAAWVARGAARDRAVRRRMMIAAPIVAAVAAVLYLLLGR
jgi:hypothetical protein